MYKAIDIRDVVLSRNGTLWRLRKDIPLYTLFEKSNFDDDNEITLVNSLFLGEPDGEWIQILEDLRGIAVQFYGVRHTKDIMHIMKDQDFEGSHLQRQCQEVYRPFIEYVQDDTALLKVCSGRPFTLNGKEITLAEVDISKYLKIS